MSSHPTTTGLLIDLTSDLIRLVDGDRDHYQAVRPQLRRIARLACRVDAERRAAVGLLGCGRIPRDVAVTLLETADEMDDPAAA